MKEIKGGVCAAKGFTAGGLHCGIRKNQVKNDLAMIYSEKRCAAAAVFTSNLVKGAPVVLSQKHLEDGWAQAVIANSGNANTCNADGMQIAEEMSLLTAEALGIPTEDVVVASTGVIGQPLSIEPIKQGIKDLVPLLSKDGNEEAAKGIMTTDTVKKEVAVEFTIGGKTCRMGGMCKGSGMIHPNMATMLAFITMDAAVSPAMLKKALLEDVKGSFNMLSIDGDTSTNDTLAVLANGMAGNAEITAEGPDYDAFAEALGYVTTTMCRKLAADGEGATKLLECNVEGAPSIEIARAVAKSVICSSLVKTAMFGADANWGRVLCAIGYAGVDVDVNKVQLKFSSPKGVLEVCKDGAGIPFSEELAKEILLEKSIKIDIALDSGDAKATAWGCDLTYDYVKINGDYRT